MNFSDFLNAFSELLTETPPDTLSAETKFKELDEWSSLLALSVVALVEDEYNVLLRGKDISESNTLGELFEKITARAG